MVTNTVNLIKLLLGNTFGFFSNTGSSGADRGPFYLFGAVILLVLIIRILRNVFYS